MGRLAAFLLLAAALAAGDAMAAGASEPFRVGITITGKKMHLADQPAWVAPRLYTWRAAAISLTRAGFGNPQRLEVSGRVYWFAAERRGGRYRVAVSLSSGKIVKVVPA